MIYDFDQIIDRTGTNSIKWEHAGGPDVIPLWVADMDFKAPPCIIEALERCVAHGIFGYVDVPDAFFQSFIRWYNERHGLKMEREWMLHVTGVVPALTAIIQALTEPGDQVVMLTPVYNCFFSSTHNSGCEDVQVPLTRDERGRFSIDYDALETALASERARILLFCNPHNPAGRVWSRNELERVATLALKHDVKVLSDEIHNEIVMPGFHYTPMASLSPEICHNTITCISPTKPWNIAGLKIACVATENAEWRERIDRAIHINDIGEVNPFGIEAAQAVYTPEGAEWMEQLCKYIRGNYQMVTDFIRSNFPLWVVTPLEGSYLVWVDIRSTGMTSEELTQMLLEKARIKVNPGSMYGEAGEGFIRINIALPRIRLEEALRRMARALKYP